VKGVVYEIRARAEAFKSEAVKLEDKSSAIKNVLLFWGAGAIITTLFFVLASVRPSLFGVFAIPMWFLPALAGIGAHDNVMPLGFVGASGFYGIIAFLVVRLVVRLRCAGVDDERL